VSSVVSAGATVSEAQVYLPLLSVPYVLGTTFESLPATVPYLSVPPSTASAGLGGDRLRVGLVWRGNPKHENDMWRSLPLSTFNPLLDVDGVSFFSLQLGKGAGECAREPWSERVTDLAPSLTDFAATAAAVNELDLVITVDTAVAHLAGAMSKSVWILVPQGNDWRWLHGRDDSPWYPTARLFCQLRERNWRPVIVAMTRSLSELAAGQGDKK
jgi:hypothetical protein